MGYLYESLSPEEAKERVSVYRYALIYNISDKLLDQVSNISEIDWDECIDARFFSENGELHVFRDEDELRYACISDDSSTENNCIRELTLDNSFSEFDGKIGKKIYFDYDDDGQVFVRMTRLTLVG